MAYYRLYRLSAPSGRFVGFEEIEAVDDAAAVQAAATFIGPRPLELWCGSRKVRTFDPVDATNAERFSAPPSAGSAAR